MLMYPSAANGYSVGYPMPGPVYTAEKVAVWLANKIVKK